jgi:hypothetical protein
MDEFVSLDNFKYREVTGTTHGTANTSLKFKHGFNAAPRLVFIVEGDVYIPFGGIGANDIDVRSTQTSQKFRLYASL